MSSHFNSHCTTDFAAVPFQLPSWGFFHVIACSLFLSSASAWCSSSGHLMVHLIQRLATIYHTAWNHVKNHFVDIRTETMLESRCAIVIYLSYVNVVLNSDVLPAVSRIIRHMRWKSIVLAQILDISEYWHKIMFLKGKRPKWDYHMHFSFPLARKISFPTKICSWTHNTEQTIWCLYASGKVLSIWTERGLSRSCSSTQGPCRCECECVWVGWLISQQGMTSEWKVLGQRSVQVHWRVLGGYQCYPREIKEESKMRLLYINLVSCNTARLT